MNTITLWLLISIGNGGISSNATTTATIERFTTSAECQRIATGIRDSHSAWAIKPDLQCLEAKVYKP